MCTCVPISPFATSTFEAKWLLADCFILLPLPSLKQVPLVIHLRLFDRYLLFYSRDYFVLSQGRIQGGAKGAIAPPWAKKGKRRERKKERKKEK